MLYNASFSQDMSCLAVCNAKGYQLYSCSPYGRFHTGGSGAIGEVEMLFTTSLIVLVGQGDDPSFSPRSMRVVNTKTESIICQLSYPTSVLKVLLNRERLVTVLETKIYIYKIQTMQLLHTIDTVKNPKGVADLTSASGAGFLVYPSGSRVVNSPNSSGAQSTETKTLDTLTEVTMFDCEANVPVNIVQAHKGPVALVKLNQDGTLLATASERGTLIRIFSVPAGTLLYELRRGSIISQIYSLCFNLSSTLLAVASATQTVHVFKLDSTATGIQSHPSEEGASVESNPDLDFQIEATVQAKKKSTGYASLFKHRVSKAKTLLPDKLSNMLDGATRDFASFKVLCQPKSEIIVALPPLINKVYVATMDGSFFQYDLSPEGGQCKKSGEYSLL